MTAESFWQRWRNYGSPTSHAEKLLSALGAFLGILAVVAVAHAVLDRQGTVMVAASMGASAVLLFALPHSPLARPWAVFGGHLVSATLGIACAQELGDLLVAGPLAVALAILGMHYARCLHPPGGATALVAVVGGPAVQSLGFGFLIVPLLINLICLLGIAMVFNTLRRRPAEVAAPDEKAMIAHSDLVYALSEIDSLIDVSEEDLVHIYNLAMRHAHADVTRTR